MLSLRTLIVAICLSSGLLMLTAWGAAKFQRIEIKGEKIAYKTAGEGDVAIILESGFGAGMETWKNVFDELSAHARVFAYHRPGYLGSTPTERPRTSLQVAEDLRELLHAVKIEPPYLMVGHSLGGCYSMEYTLRFRNEVVGIVSIDAPHLDYYRVRKEQGITTPPNLSEAQLNELSDNLRREYEAIFTMRQFGTLGDLPLIVLTCDEQYGTKEELQAKLKSQKELAALSTNGKYIVDTESSHFIPDDNPKLVIESVLQILQDARSRKHR